MFYIKPAENKDKGGIDNLGSPAEGYIQLQVKDNVGDISYIGSAE